MPGILKFVIGVSLRDMKRDSDAEHYRSAVTFTILWEMIHAWACFVYITDGYKVYPCLIDDWVRVSGAEHYHKCQ